MEYGVISRALREDNRLNGIDLAIYDTLAIFADENRQCFPSLQTISDMARFSKSSVQRSLKNLEAYNWITIQPRKTNNGKTSNLYTLLDGIKPKKEVKKVPIQEVKLVKEQTASHTQEESTTTKQDKTIVSEKHSEDIDEVLNYLTQKKGSYSSYTPLDKKYISTLLSQGYTKDNLKLVIEWKAKQWQGINYRQNLRPTTIFKNDDKHFKKYLSEAEKHVKQTNFEEISPSLMSEEELNKLKLKLQSSS